MADKIKIENEIKSWLNVVLKNKELENLVVELEGNTEPGTGYCGDIFFVKARGVTKQKEDQKYNLVIKCAKRSKAFRSKFPVNCAFLSEIYFYETVYPYFREFQLQKGVREPFDKLPKCYGTMTADDFEIIVFENLKAKGYTMWDKKKPLPRRHLERMIKAYGKFHAISIAINDQQPEKFQELASKFDDFLGKIYEYTDMITTHEELISEVYELLKGELDEDILSKWIAFKPKVRPFLEKWKRHLEGVKVVMHGDCWNNNFMHYDINGQDPDFAILDWQMVKLSSPITDVSYLIFACIAEEDIDDTEEILKIYHSALADHLREMGSDPEKLYPLEQFMKEWKLYSRFGVTMPTLIHKFSLTDGQEVPDFVQTAEDGFDIAKSMAVVIKDAPGFKKRMRYIVKYVVEHELIN